MQSLPTIPLWMGLAAAVPITWPQTTTYLMITVILSILGWTGLARVIRGKLLQLREEDYIMAAKLAGSTDWRIITTHLLPGFMSYLIVHLTLAIPFMILGETALFSRNWLEFTHGQLGRHVAASSECEDGLHAALASNSRSLRCDRGALFCFVGDGLRDAADPYKS